MRRDRVLWTCALWVAASGCRGVLGIDEAVARPTTDHDPSELCDQPPCEEAAPDAGAGSSAAEGPAAGSGGSTAAAAGEHAAAGTGAAGTPTQQGGGGAIAPSGLDGESASGSGGGQPDADGDCQPSPESCDDLDNDCDGKVDEALSQSCGRQVGDCQGGSQLCEAGSWGACKGEKEPAAEQCDDASHDENCDGSANEGCACTSGTTQSCGSDIGACQPGTQTCSDGVFASCAGAIGPAAESCDGVDNDCDGKTDEALAQACGSAVGQCRQGSQTCSAGSWGACSGATGPAGEVCDAQQLDEDCDGSANESCACIDGQTRSCGSNVGACRFGSETCVGGQWNGQCSGGQGPGSETCDAGNVDEDCDGSSNEGCACTNGATDSCGTDVGACQVGSRTCSGGAWGACQGNQGPVTEVCDAALQDEDCDGVANNGCECTIGSRRCQGAQPQLCGNAGSWQNQSACSSAQFCSAGTCATKQQYTRGNDSVLGGAPVQETGDTLYAISFSITARARLLQFGLFAPANKVGSFVRFALYSSSKAAAPSSPLGTSMEGTLPTLAGKLEVAPISALFLDPGTYWIAAIYSGSVNAYEGNSGSRADPLYYVSDAYDSRFPDPFGATSPVNASVNYYVRLEDSN